eukprot:TRINITY_DN4552_c0_g1_i1.p1 TRINITY_DN4552_c0_g1~~TRINITY_DN4552_c0_g1_i1.p1  ORF type:complete len:486 (+),score=68.89 TRINITY_DN4552_c0_g1_i1:170-1459(+)
MAGGLSVPQVFFGDEHVGGADSVCGMSVDEVRRRVAAAEPAKDERLRKPETPPVPKPKASGRNMEVIAVGKKDYTYLELAVKLRNALVRRDTTIGCTTYKHVATPDAILRCLQSTEKQLINKLIDIGILLQPTKGLYGLTSESEPNVLNRFRRWTDRVDAPMVVLSALKERLNQMKSKYRSEDGKVDYASLSMDPNWPGLLESLCELQKIRLQDLAPPLRKAFVINTYNLCITVAFAQVGIASSSLKRLAFFNEVMIDVGGDLYSFNDLENGVLRGNRKAPYSLSIPFGKGDRRLGAVMECDKRVHFALNCGAASCPPVKQFTSESIDVELDIVASAFCESDGNVHYDPKTNELTLSQIFKWYSQDFSPTPALISFLISVTRNGKRTALQSARRAPTIKHFPYSWETDASSSRTYAGPRSTQGCCCSIS